VKKITFYLVDVFAEERFSGNQLAVFRFGESLSEVEMQRIAKEMDFSETTFILTDEKEDGGYDVRIFTPNTELPFAGHPTLGTAFVIQHEIIKEPVNKIILNLKAGKIPISFNYSEGRLRTLWMKQFQPMFGRKFDAELVSKVLCLNMKDIKDDFPIQEISTGLPTVIVPLKTLDAVKRTRIDREEYFEFIRDIQAKAILIFCPETYKVEHNLNVRFFADYYGIPEDPATGSANGCLAAYLVKHRYFGKSKIDLQVEQGYEIGRPSLLFLKAEEKKHRISVNVGGKVAIIAKGKLL